MPKPYCPTCSGDGWIYDGWEDYTECHCNKDGHIKGNARYGKLKEVDETQ